MARPKDPPPPAIPVLPPVPATQPAFLVQSVSGGSIRSVRVQNHRVGACESEDEFYQYLLGVASSHSFKTRHEYETALDTARAIPLEHGIVFIHGGFAFQNTLVYNGHVSGFIDWECAGWYPEYWEFTTPSRWPSRDPEKGSLFLQLGGHRYKKELESGLAIVSLTVDSWICFQLAVPSIT
ncbi:Phosphotransferase family protein [Metarhizium guizhouense ARSEF 977]|uniref:Phosphotransferase family protein n=1 Tax=Metarhizium guizhouense (strain ARSEF 977) TaxID=1276136 RepID=A0A0B4H5W5_METGA|nr:Phosphotransferase family protein [Metarhizium guizhouense ARSEF 977]